MFKVILSLVFVLIFSMDEVFAGWVTGHVFGQYINGIPPQYTTFGDWDSNGYVKLVDPSGWIAHSTTFSMTSGVNQYYLQHPYNENIQGYKIYIYGYKTIPGLGRMEYNGIFTVNTNGGTQDLYLTEFNSSYVTNLQSTPLGDFGTAILTWEYSGDEITHFAVEKKVNNGAWTQIALVEANTPSYSDADVQVGNYYYYRVRGIWIMPVNAHFAYGGYSNEITVPCTFYPTISGPYNILSGRNYTWTASPSGASYEWRYRPTTTTQWSSIIGTSQSLTFGTNKTFYLQLKATIGYISNYKEILVYVIDNELNLQESLSMKYNFDTDVLKNFPNPFNPETNIIYSISEATQVELIVYDILGKEIEILESSWKEPGIYQVKFNATNLASGIYIYKLKTNQRALINKMIVNK